MCDQAIEQESFKENQEKADVKCCGNCKWKMNDGLSCYKYPDIDNFLLDNVCDSWKTAEPTAPPNYRPAE